MKTLIPVVAAVLGLGMVAHSVLMLSAQTSTTPVVVPPASFLSRAVALKHGIKEGFIIVPCEAGFEYGARFFVAITIPANSGVDASVPHSYVHAATACSAGRVFTIMIPAEMAAALENPAVHWTLTASPPYRERSISYNRAP